MFKLTDILREILLEMGDSSKTYPFEIDTNDLKDRNKEGLYKSGGFEYSFDTKDDITYLVGIDYFISDPIEEGKNSQVVEIGFGTTKSFATTNKFDISAVMQTIVKIIKDVRRKAPFNYIVYTPVAHDKDYYSDDKKKLQKDKLYKYFINKEFPGVKFIGDSGSRIFVKLPN